MYYSIVTSIPYSSLSQYSFTKGKPIGPILVSRPSFHFERGFILFARPPREDIDASGYVFQGVWWAMLIYIVAEMSRSLRLQRRSR